MSLCPSCGGVERSEYVWNPKHVPTMTERVEKLIRDFAVVGELLAEYRAELDLIDGVTHG